VTPIGFFIHGTNIVNIGLKVLFFGVFCYFKLIILSSLIPVKYPDYIQSKSTIKLDLSKFLVFILEVK